MLHLKSMRSGHPTATLPFAIFLYMFEKVLLVICLTTYGGGAQGFNFFSTWQLFLLCSKVAHCNEVVTLALHNPFMKPFVLSY